MYKLDKFSDMDIVTLEELEEDDEEPAKIKWKKMKRWQKVLLSILMVAVFIGIGGSATFSPQACRPCEPSGHLSSYLWKSQTSSMHFYLYLY